jgi:hypothetical protein
MIRWDNILLLLIVFLLVWVVREVAVVLSLHGSNLMDLYERIFSPELRPVFKLELFILVIAILVQVRRKMRRRSGDE